MEEAFFALHYILSAKVSFFAAHIHSFEEGFLSNAFFRKKKDFRITKSLLLQKSVTSTGKITEPELYDILFGFTVELLG